MRSIDRHRNRQRLQRLHECGNDPSQPKKPLYKDAASRARCRMGNC